MTYTPDYDCDDDDLEPSDAWSQLTGYDDDDDTEDSSSEEEDD